MSVVLAEDAFSGGRLEVTECFEVVVELTRPEYVKLGEVLQAAVKRGEFAGWEALGSQLILVTTAGL